MSRTGNTPIQVPEKVKVALAEGLLSAEGPLGKEQVTVPAHTNIEIAENVITVKRENDSKEARSMHGLARSLIANAVEGVATGFKKDLQINGVGYRAQVKGKTLVLNLGFSHPVEFEIPEGLKIEVKGQTEVSVSGSNKELVGRVAAKIRGYRPPEPYKGKGVKYADETIIRKVGKAAGGK